MDIVCSLPREYTFLNYLRCHDDIGWGLDYDTLKSWGMKEVPHKKYLNDYFQGKTESSVSRRRALQCRSGDRRRKVLWDNSVHVRY